MANEKLNWAGDHRGPKALGSATLGTGWATVGSAFRSSGVRYLNAFTDLTNNTGVDVRVRLQGMYESGGSAYALPIATVNASNVTIEPEYVEFNVDQDQRQSLVWLLYGTYPYARFQASVGTAGGTAPVLNSVNLVSAR